MKKIALLLMSSMPLFVCTVSHAASTRAETTSWAVREVARMSEAGVDAMVLEAYVERPQTGYYLQVNDVLYLHEHKVPSSVIASMLRHAPRQMEQPQVSNVAYSQPAQVAPQPPQVIYTRPAPVYVAPPYRYYPPWEVELGVGLGLSLGLPLLPHHLLFGGGHHHWRRW